MKREVAVLDVLFPIVRARMLRLLFSAPTRQRYVRELMNLSGLALCTVQDELRKLSAVGLVTSRSNGYHRYYQANQRHPFFGDIIRIVEASARLPAAKHAALHRKRSRRARDKRPRRPIPLSVDRPLKWNLFSHQPHR
jgi:predicted transcriptional regulator